MCIEASYHEIYKSYNSIYKLMVAHLLMTGTVMINHAETLMNDNNIMSTLSRIYIVAPSEAIIMHE